ncbi:hypothetical protein CISIN_1g036242mg, partial [Citrus sinensis]
SFLHWTYDPSTNVVDLAFRRSTPSSQWVTWALNPSGQRMAGSKCHVAFRNSTGAIRAYTSPIGSGTPTLQEGSLSFRVTNITATLVGNEWTIFARLHLYSDLHPITGDNARSVGTIDFRTGQIASNAGDFDSRQRKRNFHQFLSILMPMGAMMARYLKVFRFGNPAWFYLHVACQVSAYIIGVAGWATGIDLSSGISSLNRDYIHRNIGIALFFLATVQVFALLLRPKPDHKYRLYWNIYHWAVGYAIIVTSVFNVLKGLSLLDPEIQWWHAYIVTAISSGIISAALEAITWTIVVKRKKASEEKQNQRTNGVNEANGHAARTVRLEPEV